MEDTSMKRKYIAPHTECITIDASRELLVGSPVIMQQPITIENIIFDDDLPGFIQL